MNARSSITWLAVAAMLLIGHFLPWARHNTAALTLSGHDLAIFLNDTPHAGTFANEWFYLPVWTAGMLIALAANRSDKGMVVRVAMALAAMGVASLGLPPFERMRDLARDFGSQPDYTLRLVISLAVMADCAVLALLRRTKIPWGLGAFVCALNFIPLYGYSLMRWPIEQLYGNAVDFGGGWWVTLFTVIGVVVVTAWNFFRPQFVKTED